MEKRKTPSTLIIKIILWVIIFYSALALIYHVRWFIPALKNNIVMNVPLGEAPILWFTFQALSDILFVCNGVLLLNIFRKYNNDKFFDISSIKVFNVSIASCIILAFFGFIKTFVNNFKEVHFDQWQSFESITNLAFRSFTNLLVFREPQTILLLMAIILWVVKQFTRQALVIKKENESFI